MANMGKKLLSHFMTWIEFGRVTAIYDNKN